MKSSDMINKIKTLLDIPVKLEERKLENGTVVEAEAFEKGREIFLEQGTCASCHTLNDAESQANIGPNLNEIRPDLNRVIIAVTNGIGVMPSFEDMLSTDEINSVAHYVYTATE